MTRKLLISGLLVAGLTASAGFAAASDPSAQAREFERSDGYTDTPLSPEDVRRKPVFDEQRDKVGVVKDVVESTRFGPLAIVEVRGVLGVFAKRVAVALDQLVLEPDGRLVALLDDEDFKSLPEFKDPAAVRS